MSLVIRWNATLVLGIVTRIQFGRRDGDARAVTLGNESIYVFTFIQRASEVRNGWFCLERLHFITAHNSFGRLTVEIPWKEFGMVVR